MSTQEPSNIGKRKLLKDSPFSRLAQRTVETGNEALKEARQIDITRIDTNPRQPRRNFNAQNLAELSQDIAARGILQPPIVRPIAGSNRFEIVVGERRYQAARQAGLKVIPVLVRDLDDQEAEVTSLVENIQREDLTLPDEVNYFKMLQTKYDYSIREIAEEVAHKSASYVEVRLKLADFPEVLALVVSRKLGLQEANLLMRDKSTLRQKLEQLKTSLEKSQSVFSKDTKLKNSQISEKGKPDTTGPYKGLAAAMSKPFQDMIQGIHLVTRRLDVGRVAEEDRQSLLSQLDELEQEILQLKRRLNPL